MIFDILEENDYYKTLLVRQLEHYNNQEVTEYKICIELEISKYKLEQFIFVLNKELIENHIYVNKEGILIYNPITTVDLEKLKYLYIQRSEQFKLLQYIVEGEKNVKKFSEKEFISLPQVYRKRTELTLFLKNELGLSLKGMKLIANNELNLRNKLYDLYYFYFGGFKLPFSKKIDVKCKEIQKIVVASIPNRLSKTELSKLNVFICIQTSRCLLGHVLLEEEIINLNSMVQIKTEELNLPALTSYGIPNTEKLLLMVYIGLNVSKRSILITNESFLKELILIFKNLLKHYLVPSSYLTNEFLQKCLPIFVNWFIFSNRATTFIEENQINYFKEMYPVFHSISFNFVDEYCRNLFVDEIDSTQLAKYYYDVIFFLIGNIPVTEVEPIVNICVDFSHGEIYNGFIKRNIENYKDLTIHLQDFSDNTTDIYLSDIYLPNLVPQQIIWRNPPTSNDWVLFAEHVLAIREVKFENKK